MKRTIGTLILLITSIYSIQAQDYLSDLAKKTCKCLDDAIAEGLDRQGVYSKVGVFMISEGMVYKRQLKKDHDIDLDNVNEKEGEKLGVLLGTRMIAHCPESVMLLASETNSKEETDNHTVLDVEGEILTIKKDVFVIFSVKNEEEKTYKFYWINPIESGMDLPNSYETLSGAKVSITYVIQEVFDARIGEYRNINVVRSLNKL